jgi:hypothetical protein
LHVADGHERAIERSGSDARRVIARLRAFSDCERADGRNALVENPHLTRECQHGDGKAQD